MKARTITFNYTEANLVYEGLGLLAADLTPDSPAQQDIASLMARIGKLSLQPDPEHSKTNPKPR